MSRKVEETKTRMTRATGSSALGVKSGIGKPSKNQRNDISVFIVRKASAVLVSAFVLIGLGDPSPTRELIA
jgi:hypothetical protein